MLCWRHQQFRIRQTQSVAAKISLNKARYGNGTLRNVIKPEVREKMRLRSVVSISAGMSLMKSILEGG